MYRILPLLLLFALSCDNPPPRATPGEIETSPTSQIGLKVETVAANLEVPWSIVWAPDGRMLFTERPGRIRVYENGKLRVEPFFTVPDVEATGESGLMSIALHPQFATNRWIYVAYAYKSNGQRVRVVRYRETSSRLDERTVIIEDIPAARFHAGCRIKFGPDGKLYITTGDGGNREAAQRFDSLAGKTLRVNDDGSIPSDNPFVGQAGALPQIWSYGHRNAQGMDWQSGSNLMFQTEHGPTGFDGPDGGDEVNVVESGKNYGWPVTHHRETRPGMESPIAEYTPACAPASAMFYRADKYPQFRDDFLFGCLRGARIIRLKLNGRRVTLQESLFTGSYGRIREVAEGPDGLIYFSTSNRDGRGSPASDDDRILRIILVK